MRRDRASERPADSVDAIAFICEPLANRIDSLAASMRQKASELDRADTLEKRNKIDKELCRINRRKK